MGKVKFSENADVAVDDNGYDVKRCKTGDIIELSDRHCESLIQSRVAVKVNDDAPATVSSEPKPAKPAGKARGGGKQAKGE